MRRLLIAGSNSGCGKTTLSCALLAAYKARGINLSAFKSGPDYLDPMFHRAASDVSTHTLDPFFLDGESLRRQLTLYAGELSIIEGAMGFYDGIAATEEASAYTVARETRTPVVLVLNARGIGNSIGAIIEGYLGFRENNGICGVLFNNASAGFYPDLQRIAERAGVPAFGYLPHNDAWSLPSRHLGLMRASEVEGLRGILLELGKQAEATIDLDALLELAATAPMPKQETTGDARLYSENIVLSPSSVTAAPPSVISSETKGAFLATPREPSAEDPSPMARDDKTNRLQTTRHLRLAVARDEAFCFIYEENLDILRALGCEIAFFSPLADEALPAAIHGLYLPGGYPELHTQELSTNDSLREQIRRAVTGGLPTIAECGGFLYLHSRLDGAAMCGVIEGESFETKHLQRFGYHTLVANRDNLLCRAGDSIRAREFHYWESSAPGDGFTAHKAGRSHTHACVHATETLYAGFPHLFFPANPAFATSFVERMALHAG